jgi:hypothetical protein
MAAFDPYRLLHKARAASVVDAMGRAFEHRAQILDLVTPTPGRKLFGPALTMSFLPYRQDLFDPKQSSLLFALTVSIQRMGCG